MSAKNPKELVEFFDNTWNASDFDAAVKTYEVNAVIIDDSKHYKVADYLKACGRMGTNLKSKIIHEVPLSATEALLHVEWKQEHSDRRGLSICVVRQQSDGTWLFATSSEF